MYRDTHAMIRSIMVSDLFVNIPGEQIGLDDGLQSVLGLDSVGLLELRVLCERRFQVRIGDSDFTPDNFASIRRLSSLVQRLQLKMAK
jgi:acyl carrier protein